MWIDALLYLCFLFHHLFDWYLPLLSFYLFSSPLLSSPLSFCAATLQVVSMEAVKASKDASACMVPMGITRSEVPLYTAHNLRTHTLHENIAI
jgi:hypothetical protein